MSRRAAPARSARPAGTWPSGSTGTPSAPASRPPDRLRMPLAIEDYALIGDCHTGALVGRDGNIDWLCLPRFDSASTFGALLGDFEQGHWRVAPVGATIATSREYREDTFVLVTHWVTDEGEVEVVDLMPHGDR